MKKIIYTTSLITLFMLTGCTSDSHTDLQEWMKDQRIAQKGKIKNLPAARTFVPVAFNAPLDPFKDRPIISLNDVEKTKYAPDPNRRKEPLESYALEQLKMTGTLIKDKVVYAMIKTPDGSINYVSRGNYIGMNYGQIVKVEDGLITINERINDNDEWKIKENQLSLE